MKTQSHKRTTVNRRHAESHAWAQLGYYTPEVKKVVKKWKHREKFLKNYFLPVAAAALWNTNELNVRVYARSHWPMIWDISQACEKVRKKYGKNHPTYWLLKLNINIVGNVDFGGEIRPTTREDSWAEIRWQIEKLGGPNFSEAVLRQHAKRLGLVSPL